ncbi:MAG: hypothetical protein IKI77_10425 [Oscillospiraceae bacterium]|nr:hypothetical protein [Oscillospiraceae bacterium]
MEDAGSDRRLYTDRPIPEKKVTAESAFVIIKRLSTSIIPQFRHISKHIQKFLKNARCGQKKAGALPHGQPLPF